MPMPRDAFDGSANDRDLDLLTRRAVAAAERGDWATVQSCYERRGEQLAADGITAAQAERLLQLDASVTERLALAQAAVRQVLSEVVAVRRRSDLVSRATADLRAVGGRLDHLT